MNDLIHIALIIGAPMFLFLAAGLLFDRMEATKERDRR